MGKRIIPVLFEDESIAVVNKPAGVLTIPTGKKETNTLIDILNYPYRETPNHWRFHPCHRLDRGTSGVLIFAKGKRAQQEMMGQFKARTVKKMYIAFVHGCLPRKHGTITRPIPQSRGAVPSSRRVRTISAITQYRVVEKKDDFSVLQVFPITGRTNQIRIHLCAEGHPLVGERKFAVAKNYPLKFRRPALHSARIQFQDVHNKKSITVTAPLPNDMEDFIERH